MTNKDASFPWKSLKILEKQNAKTNGRPEVFLCAAFASAVKLAYPEILEEAKQRESTYPRRSMRQ